MADILSLPVDTLLPSNNTTGTLRHAKETAKSLISKPQSDPSALPDTLRKLLTQIIKPLFTSTPHPNLTSSGRKLLVSQPPALPNSGLASDHLAKRQWENPLTIPLLTAILHTYPTLPESTRKQTFEEHFYVLVPPILNIIDHHATPNKVSGYRLLRLLAEASLSANSAIIKRSGLMVVFVDSLKTNFMMLPTLTPEQESMEVLGELYPAFFTLVEARFVELPAVTEENRFETSSEIEERVKYLTLLLRHAVLSGLQHLGAGTTTTGYVEVTTSLMRQLKSVIDELGVYTVRDLNVIIPMMRAILMDPFAVSASHLLIEVLGVVEIVVQVCEERVKERWWAEVFRGLVGCWCNVLDEEDDFEEGKANKGKKKDLGMVKSRLQEMTRELGKVVTKEDWQDAKLRLIKEEQELQDLFEGT